MTQHKARNKKTKYNFPQKDSRKRKLDLILPIIFGITPVERSCYRVIDSSIPQECFSSIRHIIHAKGILR